MCNLTFLKYMCRLEVGQATIVLVGFVESQTKKRVLFSQQKELQTVFLSFFPHSPFVDPARMTLVCKLNLP